VSPTPTVEELSREAKFIFRGTVKERGATTVPEAPVSQRTLIVAVDEILESPELLRAFEGQDITVQLGEGQRVKVGQQRMFFTNVWVYGASIAVLCVGHRAPTAAVVSRTKSAIAGAPLEAVRERAARAELVVTGRVVEVREVERPLGAPITEHDPGWREAVVQVDSLEMGALHDPGTNQVVVRFAGSDDVKWRESPKFSVDQEGVWMLGDTGGDQVARAAMGERPGRYVAVDAIDFQPKEEVDRVRSLIEEGQGP
jgi:hypothetical protein